MNLKQDFLKGIMKDIVSIEDQRKAKEKEARSDWKWRGLSYDSMELLFDDAQREEKERLCFLYNLCIDRGCTEQDLTFFPDTI